MLKVCDEAMATAAVCRNILFLLCGYNKAEMNSTVRPSWDILSRYPTFTHYSTIPQQFSYIIPQMLPVIMGHTPAGTSANTMIHYGQSVKTGGVHLFNSSMSSSLVPNQNGPAWTLGHQRQTLLDGTVRLLRDISTSRSPPLWRSSGGRTTGWSCRRTRRTWQRGGTTFSLFFVSNYVSLSIFLYFLPQVAQLGEQHEGGRRRLHPLGLPLGHAQ